MRARAAARHPGKTAASPSEIQTHRAVAELLDLTLLPPAMWTTFPAGWGKLGRATAGSLKGAGLKPGMPDILIFHNGRCIGIELKTYKGTLTNVQKVCFAGLGAAGVHVYLCRTVDEVVEVLVAEKIPTRKMTLAA